MKKPQEGLLRNAYGDDIILYDEQGGSTVYQLLAEFVYGNYTYAVLQSEELKKEDVDVAIFRVVEHAEQQYELETIEDDDEWETVSELYDEMMFPVKEIL
ncbi:DUF1292 domain-containing protein [Paenibacillus sp. GP183]|jgi:uncharacterized protein YrzB (UPF0473 family)|uniref:DUF1292 domain-containing protein n=1 Tax=Paenibacillus sp. GP183 TaxID=1882751 RepID=UPI000896CCE6|nr:DUF1292 domain-containing protein [Paenibacillus sp. GP183]SEC73913.1 Protein of unknown function [Paenibacillus sp. GP183]